MKRTRSPSPPSSSSRRKLTETDNEDSTVLSTTTTTTTRRGLKSLQGLEIHPLLNDTSSALKSSVAPEEIKENPFLAHWKKPAGKANVRVPHVDKNLAIEPASHRPRPLKFNAPGKFIAKAEAERTAAQIRLLEREIAEATEDFAADLDVSLIADLLRDNETTEESEVFKKKSFEWWDVPFITFSSDNLTFSLNYDLLGNLIQRPSLQSHNSNTDSSSSSSTLKIYLTPEEQKKLRRQRRLEAQKELQEKIALGLLPPPPPKIKLSSLPRMLAQPGNALGDDSVQDPTRIASEIRAQSQARHVAHQQGNANRKLTEQERAAKNFRKYAELDAPEIHVALFKLNDRLEDKGRRFKVSINAEQNHLHGRAITTPEFTLIIVEGGPKGIKRYSRLLLERIEPDHADWAQLLWSGIQDAKSDSLTDPAAGNKAFQFKIFDKNFEAIEYLEKLKMSHFWSLCASSVNN